MDAELKKTLKAVTLELRHLLEGRYDQGGQWKPGDLEQRLAAIGVRRDRASVPVDEFGHLAGEDRQARKVVDAYLKLRDEAGVERSEAVAEFVRETAYTWANRLLALRCMEARELIDSVILQQEAYAGRSLEHHRLAQRHPELCADDDDGLFAVLDKVFRAQAGRLPMLFDPQAPGIALRPSAAALKDCFGLLSLNPDTLRKHRIRLTEDETANSGAKPPNPFTAPDALGWAYQYWNTEEKNRVFETVRTVKGAKIAGADIIPATQLYTEDYMVKFLVQNSLGATWMGMYPESKLAENWEYYVKDADRAPVEKKSAREITFLDPACGSGHFHLEAFDLFYAMYQEEGELTAPEEICNAILTKNLFGIDIDPRAVQIAEVALWMKAAERAFDYKGVPTNLVAATSSHLKGEAWEEFLAGFEREPSVARVLRSFARTMEHIDEIGSLARPAENLREIIKEEHATWERQVSEKKEANFLFPEMNEAVVSGQLPFQEISDEEFGDRLFYRAKAGIDAFTERARASGDFEDQILGSETRAGFRLVDLLSRRYDIVNTNPPYLGSRGMGDRIKNHLALNYNSGRHDLYAAFLLRAQEMTESRGYFAVVTMQTWMFLRSFQDLRHGHADDAPGVLRRSRLTVLAHLGPNAFAEITGEVVSVCLTIFQQCLPDEAHAITAFRLLNISGSVSKAKSLRTRKAGISADPKIHRIKQVDLLRVPEAPIIYWLPDEVLKLLFRENRLRNKANICLGLCTGRNERFLRYVWEIPGAPVRWVPYVKGGRFQRWAGLEWYLCDWRKDKVPYLETSGSAVRNPSFYFRDGYTYSMMGSGSLGVRVLAGDGIFDQKSVGFFPNHGSGLELAAIANTYCATYMLRALTPTADFNPGYVELLPLAEMSDSVTESIRALASKCIEAARQIASLDTKERSFRGTFELRIQGRSFRELFGASEALKEDCELELLHAEAEIEHIAKHTYALSESTWSQITSEVGSPPGLIERPINECALGTKNGIEEWYLNDHTELQNTEEESDSNDEVVQTNRPIPVNGLLGRLITAFSCRGSDVVQTLRDLRNQGRVPPGKFRHFILQTCSEWILRIIGHTWTFSNFGIGCSEGVDGIARLVTSVDDAMMARKLDGLATDILFADASSFRKEFHDAVGSSLESWLLREFFPQHISQFEKRPIAWQLQSGKFTARMSPAFACLLHYHKLDADTLAKLSSQYIGPLRQRLETEQRGILAVAAEARSERQVKRRGELEDAIVELQKFDTVLEIVARTGFCPQSLFPTIRQNAIDDAMLALKVRWLHRLTELIAKSPLPDWLAAADRTELHPDFRGWIADAMAHLDYFCSKVGPKAPDQAKLTSDPTATDLAKLIAPHAKEMLKDTLELACDKWYAQFDDIVLGPDKDEVKKLREEQKSSEEQLEQLRADPDPSTVAIRKLDYRVKEIKQDVKTLTAKIKRKAALANKVRTQIESWESKEPSSWGDWLAEQPLFDRVASLDGRRATPTTIAEFITQESLYAPDINDGVRVNIAPLQKAGILAADVLAAKDLDKAIADRAEWRADERRWVREGKLPQPGWWPENGKK